MFVLFQSGWSVRLYSVRPTSNYMLPWLREMFPLKQRQGLKCNMFLRNCFCPFPPVCTGWLTENREQSVAALIWKHSAEGCWNEITKKLWTNLIKSRCLLLKSCSAEVTVRLQQNEWQTFRDKTWALISDCVYLFRLSKYYETLWTIQLYFSIKTVQKETFMAKFNP